MILKIAFLVITFVFLLIYYVYDSKHGVSKNNVLMVKRAYYFIVLVWIALCDIIFYNDIISLFNTPYGIKKEFGTILITDIVLFLFFVVLESIFILPKNIKEVSFLTFKISTEEIIKDLPDEYQESVRKLVGDMQSIIDYYQNLIDIQYRVMTHFDICFNDSVKSDNDLYKLFFRQYGKYRKEFSPSYEIRYYPANKLDDLTDNFKFSPDKVKALNSCLAGNEIFYHKENELTYIAFGYSSKFSMDNIAVIFTDKDVSGSECYILTCLLDSYETYLEKTITEVEAKKRKKGSGSLKQSKHNRQKGRTL